MTRKRIIAVLAALMHLQMLARAYAGPPIIWNKPYPLVMDSGVRIQKSDTTTTCNAAAAASIRNNAGTLEACNGTAWGSLGGSSATAAIAAGNALNCAIAVSQVSSALTVALRTAGGATPSSSDPCVIVFRSSTATNGTLASVNATVNTTFVVSNGSSLGCPTTAAQCILNFYALNNAGTIELAAKGGDNLDEASLQTSVAEGGTGTADSNDVVYSGTARSTVAFRKIGRALIAPGAGFQWTTAITEVASGTSYGRSWYISAYIDGQNPSLGVADISSYTEIINTTLTAHTNLGSYPVGALCAKTGAAATLSIANTTCAGGTGSIGLAFQIPSPGAYEVCAGFGHLIQADTGIGVDSTFQLIETATNNTALVTEGGDRIISGMNGAVITTLVNQQHTNPVRVCSIFDWQNKAPGTTVAVRVMYEQDAKGGSPDLSNIYGDGDTTVGQRNIAFTVKRLN